MKKPKMVRGAGIESRGYPAAHCQCCDGKEFPVYDGWGSRTNAIGGGQNVRVRMKAWALLQRPRYMGTKESMGLFALVRPMGDSDFSPHIYTTRREAEARLKIHRKLCPTLVREMRTVVVPISIYYFVTKGDF